MEKKINIAELLKDCPSGMKLDCTICNGVKFIELDRSPNFPIVVRANNGYEFSLTKYGQVHNIADAKCVIFPKGKTTWEGFQRPFKDGDVIYTYNFIAILSHIAESGAVWYHCYYCISTKNFNAKHYCGIGNINNDEFRLATEEEKAKLFQAIKDNGYKWNAETKTLEKWKLVSNKFDITTLKPFQKVLVRDSDKKYWGINLFGFYNEMTKQFHCMGNSNIGWNECIPYEGNEHLLGTTNNCDKYYKTW